MCLDIGEGVEGLASDALCKCDLGTPLFAADDETRGGGGNGFFECVSDEDVFLDWDDVGIAGFTGAGLEGECLGL